MVLPGRDPAGEGALPGPHAGQMWAHFDGPREGSLDVDTWLTLLDVLVPHTPGGADARCCVFYTPWADHDLPSVLCGPLSQARDLVDYTEREVSPQNIWPEDLAWLVYTDYDGVATRVNGTRELIHDLQAATELETYTTAGDTIA